MFVQNAETFLDSCFKKWLSLYRKFLPMAANKLRLIFHKIQSGCAGRAKLCGRGCKIFFVFPCDLRSQVVRKQPKTLYPECNFRRESIIVLLKRFYFNSVKLTLLCRNSLLELHFMLFL